MILIVDDDQAMRKLLKRTFAGEKAVAVGTVEEGLTAAYAKSPTVILLDVIFAGQAQGVNAIQAFRSVTDDRSAVIVMTGHYSTIDQWRAIALGASAYIEKGDVRALERLVSEFSRDAA